MSEDLLHYSFTVH